MSQTLSSNDCFEHLIALRGACSDEESLYSIWVNDLGIDMNFISQVITKDYTDPADFFNRKKNFAIKTVANQIHNFLKPKYKASTVIQNFRVGHFQENLKLIAGTGTLKGIELDLCQSNSYLDVFINEIALQINSTGSVDVLVYDLTQNKLLDTITVDVQVADEITRVFVNKVYKSDKKRINLFIGYDSTGISSNTTRLKKDCVNCSGNYYKEITNPYEKIRAAQIAQSDPKIKENLDYLNETGGLSVVHSLSCNHENWLCSISNQMAFPVLYKTAYLIYDHAQTSRDQRVNTSVTLNAEMVQERLDKMDFYYSESMNNLLQNIKPPQDEICFACKDNVRMVVQMP